MTLPVEELLPGLSTALAVHGTAVVMAPPGTGKTTLVPLHLMEADSILMMLEPRRVATRAAARRMASLLGEPVGGRVGYVTRDDRQTGPSTRVEVVTEGILTRRLQRDPFLEGIHTVIFDEFHERNLQSDMGMALALDVRNSVRPDLRIVVMSATIDAEAVSALLGGAPILTASASLHPVEMVWAPRARSASREGHVAATIRRSLQRDEGDILVFLAGMGEILKVERALGPLPATVHRLHGSLSMEDQDRALMPGDGRKVILSTDIAESSLTVEGVSVVIDSGEARTPRFDSRTQMTRLVTVAVSRASADQRSGRAGRLGPGVAYRLWSRLEHGTRASHSPAEITQVDLTGVALELSAWGGSDQLKFLDPPPTRTLEEAYNLLQRLGAVDRNHAITAAGRRLAEIPLHPRLAAMVDRAGRDRQLACILAAIVDDRDPLRGPPNELPVDIALRAALVVGIGSHPAADRHAVERLRRTADDLCRRLGVETGEIDPARAGRLLATAFPDRIAIRRGSPGRFQIKAGPTAFFDAGDALAGESFVVAVDLDGHRRDSRIRMAAVIDSEDVADLFADEVTTVEELAWEGDRVVAVKEQRLGGLAIRIWRDKPEPSPAVVNLILKRVEKAGINSLSWSDAAIEIRNRSSYLHTTVGDPWPDLRDGALTESLTEWLEPLIRSATTVSELTSQLLDRAMRASIGRNLYDLDRFAPRQIRLASGRTVKLDYSQSTPILAARVQDLFGETTTPLVGGRPVQVHLLSPAGRPVQITTDLEGFWSGSWHQVRKEMAGRYPKHPWPEKPH